MGKKVDPHEECHERAAARLGLRTTRIYEGGEHVKTRIHGIDKLSPVERAAISYAAHENGHRDTRGDRRIAEEDLREVPWSQRGSARREARRLGRKLGR